MYKELESFQDPDRENREEFRGKLIEFIRSIEYFKQDVDSFFNASDDYEPQYEWPKEAKDFISRTSNEMYKTQRFSDGIMIYSPLIENEEGATASSILTALTCTASTMLMSLARGNPIRVGVGIGGAVEIDEGELFGPAIGCAHEMESKRAIFPRIAVHESVVGYLESHTKPKTKTLENIDKHYVYEIHSLIKMMLKKDDDGEIILDYLGPTVWDHTFQGGDENLLKYSYEFIKRERQRFKDKGDTRILTKYEYLHRYFVNSRHEIFKMP